MAAETPNLATTIVARNMKLGTAATFFEIFWPEALRRKKIFLSIAARAFIRATE